MIDIIQYIILACTFLASASLLHLSWALYSLHHHPSIEPIAIAQPEISATLQQLLEQLSQLAEITTPDIYIRRAALPNAFVVASVFRQDIYLTDEMLETCDEQDNPLDYLSFVLCHEICHIKRNDSIRLGILTYAGWAATCLRLRNINAYIEQKTRYIEQQTDSMADKLLGEYKQKHALGACRT